MNATRKTDINWRYGRKLMNGALAAVAMAAIGTPPAQATDDKIYPGSMCVRFEGSTPRLNASRLFNPGTTVMKLDCPAIHDFINESIDSGSVDVIDQNFVSGGDVCANLVSVSQSVDPEDSGALTVKAAGRKCTKPGGGLEAQRLSFGGVAANPKAHYFYSVSIPSANGGGFQSAIISYRVNEND